MENHQIQGNSPITNTLNLDHLLPGLSLPSRRTKHLKIADLNGSGSLSSVKLCTRQCQHHCSMQELKCCWENLSPLPTPQTLIQKTLLAFLVVGFLRGGCSRGGGSWGTLGIPRKDWLGHIREDSGIHHPQLGEKRSQKTCGSSLSSRNTLRCFDCGCGRLQKVGATSWSPYCFWSRSWKDRRR